MKRAVSITKWIAVSVLSAIMAVSLILPALSSLTSAFSFTKALADGIVKVDESNNTKKYIVNDTVRVTPLSGSVVRLEEKGKNGFEDRETFYVLGRENFVAPDSECEAVGDEILITAGSYRVHIPKNATNLDGTFVTDAGNATLYRYNGVSLPNTYLPSPSDDLRGWYFSDNPRIVPGENGYSVTEEEIELNGWDFENKAPDVYVFVPENYAGFCEDFVTLTGKSNLVDLKNLGFWDSRWYVYDDKAALQQIQDYLDKGYSIDMLVIDTNWRKGEVNQTPGMDPAVGGMGYEIDENLFPNMSEFLDKAHEMGVNVIFNDHPEPVKGTTSGLDKDEIEYRSDNLKLILSLGLDMWWYDRNWSTALNSPDQDLSVFAWGMYAFQFIENEYYEDLSGSELQEYARRAIIMGNIDGCLHGNWKYASDLSSHRYTIQWTGDIGVDEHALALEIRDSIYGSVENGIPYVSSDIGGHTSSVTDDMYSRWIQYGALSTITRVHCTHEVYCGQVGRMPWLFGDTAEEITKEYVGMKYNLMPTYYSLAAKNALTGLPILRRLDIAYPQYREASRNDEFLLGDGIIVAPINEAYVSAGFDEGFFTYTDGGITKNGLLGSYYSNKNCSGEPVYTQSDKNFIFDWGLASPKKLPADNFSIKWEGDFKVGDTDMKFSFFADDSVQVFIDNKEVVNSYDEKEQKNRYDVLFETEYYKAGTSHSIEIRYGEEGNNAHFFMYGMEKLTAGASYCYDTREVFLPDGTWIDVWSGKEYQGPFTYKVTHPLETSPIFVRKGSLAVLAPDMKNLNEKDWSELTLDAYPSASYSETTLYEDDTVTQAYKFGKYRTTKITAEAVDGKYTVKIGKAVGEFEGEKAFTTRKWNVRLHAFEELGAVKSITVNGKRVAGISYFTRNSDASPFSFTGASADTAVYQFSFSGSVTQETTIVVEFANNSALATFAKNAAYDASSATFDITSANLTNNYINLDNSAYDDWVYFGNETARKSGANHVIGELTSDFEMYASQTAAIQADWTNGEGVALGEGVSRGVTGQVDANVTLKVMGGGTKVYTLYLVSEQCIGKLTVRDRAGNVKTIILDEEDDSRSKSGALNNSFNGVTARKVTIAVSADEDTEIYVRYSVHSSRKDAGAGTGSAARVGISAIVYGDAAAQDTMLSMPELPQTELTLENAPDSANLSQAADGDVLDWYKSNYGDEGEVYMQGGEAIRSVSFTATNKFGDYKTVLSWNDGEGTQSCSGTRNGYHTESNGKIELVFSVDENTKYIVLYAGAWNGGNQIEVFDYNGVRKGIATFTAGGTSECKKVLIPVNVSGKTRIRVVITSTGAHDGGNASLSGVQVVGKRPEN